MLIRIETPVSLSIEKPQDLAKLRIFMQDNNLKLNKSEIARQLNMDRRTVSKYLDGFEKASHRDKKSKVAKYDDIINDLLSSDTQIFQYKKVLHQYLSDNYGMDIPLPTFYHYIQSVPKYFNYFKDGKMSDVRENPVIRYETPPGAQAQIDWKESIPFVLKGNTEPIHIHILVVILGYSRMRVYKPALDMTQETLLHLLTEAFEAFGGVPKVLLTDNMKTVMSIARTLNHEGTPNERFEAYAKDFGFEIQPCVAATPKTKGKIESQMKFLDEIKAYSGTLDLVGLYELIDRINRRVNNSICQGTARIPLLEYQKEKDSLLPLPHETIRNHYRIKTVDVETNTAGMISVHSNQYSVPYEYIGKKVQYQIHDSNIYIYYNTKLIAVHKLTERKLNYSAEHYSSILALRHVGKTNDDIARIAQENLKIIGGIFE